MRVNRTVAVRLQELLTAQQQLAEEYRHEARLALEQLAEVQEDGPIVQRRRHREQEALRQLRTELELEQNSRLSGMQTMLDAMRHELHATRDATEEQHRRVQTAQLLVL